MVLLGGPLPAQKGPVARVPWLFGYDSSNEELCVNEMLAYLATERDLLRRYAARSEGGEGEGATLEVVQADFVRFVEGHIPEPKPRLRGQYTAYS